MSAPYWEPLAAAPSASLPPVVNGQWVKGVGGAAVWSPIQISDLPGYPSDAGKALMGDSTWQAVTRMVDGQYGAGILPANTVKMQIGGQIGMTVPAGDPATITLPLHVAWPSVHLAFFGSAWPGSSWNITPHSIGTPLNLSSGQMAFNNPASQSCNISWISFGW